MKGRRAGARFAFATRVLLSAAYPAGNATAAQDLPALNQVRRVPGCGRAFCPRATSRLSQSTVTPIPLEFRFRSAIHHTFVVSIQSSQHLLNTK